MSKKARYPECAADDKGKPCGGPLIPSSSHPRAGEIPTPLICAACGEFTEGTPELIEAAEAAERASERRHVADERQAERDARDRRRGVDPAAFRARRTRQARRGAEQLGLWGRR